MKKIFVVTLLAALVAIYACSKKDLASADPYPAITAAFGNNIEPGNLFNYANQPVPGYITKDNSGSNPVHDAKATLGRVLFYDKNLSINNTVSCGSCHRQEFAFSDTSQASKGVEGGITGRHSMRLINTRFAEELKFFWDERAASLEEQTTRPIQDHAEMGFSGQIGRPGMADLLTKLGAIGYYQELFQFVYGNTTITEQRLQECLANFIRSIQSFDSRFDAGRSLVPNDGAPFPNFTQQENAGKQLFLQPPQFDANGSRIGGGFGCQGCHRAPEFDIDPNSRNNGIISRLNAAGPDLTNTRSPSLRDLLNPSGISNGPLMHAGLLPGIQNAILHYNNIVIVPGNTNIDSRLTPGGVGQRLNATPTEINNLLAFMRTLSGNTVYTDERWADPF